MMVIAASPRWNVRCLRQSSTGHHGTRPDTHLNSQRDQSSSFNVSRFDDKKPLIQRNELEPCAAPSRYLANTQSAALKSP